MPAKKTIENGTDFKTAYDILQNNAQILQNSEEPNIDTLMDIVAESVTAYKACQTRIEAVEKALEQAFNDK